MWTKNKPSEPGYYWHRESKSSNPELVKIIGSDGGKACLLMQRQGCQGTWLLKFSMGEFFSQSVPDSGGERFFRKHSTLARARTLLGLSQDRV
jgi:hypothetical protein